MQKRDLPVVKTLFYILHFTFFINPTFVSNAFPMAWLLLIIAGLFEVAFTTCLAKAKTSTGSTAAWWLAGFLAALTCSMFLLYSATKELPMGTAYAVWTGIGAAGTVLIGIIFFQEPAHFWRLFFLFTLIASIIGLKFIG